MHRHFEVDLYSNVYSWQEECSRWHLFQCFSLFLLLKAAGWATLKSDYLFSHKLVVKYIKKITMLDEVSVLHKCKICRWSSGQLPWATPGFSRRCAVLRCFPGSWFSGLQLFVKAWAPGILGAVSLSYGKVRYGHFCCLIIMTLRFQFTTWS